LCKAAISPETEVSRKALQALEKEAPHLYHAVLTLIVDGGDHHRRAIGELSSQGARAKPALVVLNHHMRKCLADLKEQSSQGEEPSGHLQALIEDHLYAMALIAPEEPQVVRIAAATAGMVVPGCSPRRPFLRHGISAMAEIAQKRPEHRNFIAQMFVKLAEGWAAQLSTDQPVETIQCGLQEISSIALAFDTCDARAMVGEKLAPALEELEFHPDATVRTQAHYRKQWFAEPKPREVKSGQQRRH
jgi:hypothetical protein